MGGSLTGPNKMNFQAPSFGRVIYRPENQADNIYKASIGCNGFIGNRFRFWAIKDCLETTYLPGLKQKIIGIGSLNPNRIQSEEGIKP